MSNNLVGVERRLLLGASVAGLGALAGCEWGARSRSTPAASPDQPTDDALLVEAALVSVREAQILVAETTRRYPRLVGRLEALSQAHARQVTLLTDLTGRSSPTPSPSSSPSSSPTSSPGLSVAATLPRALADVRSQEQSLTQLFEKSCLTARDRTLARVFGVSAAGLSVLVSQLEGSHP